MSKIRVHAARCHTVDLKTRMPFKYGIATMTAFPLCFVEIDCEIDGRSAPGIASDLLPPKWFKKDPQQEPASELHELRSVIHHACALSQNREAPSIYACWKQVYDEQAMWGRAQGLPPLLTHFGSSLIERALIDALCRHLKIPFHEALRENRFGIRFEDINPDLKLKVPTPFLRKKPLDRVIARHTIGLSDPLTHTDIPDEEHLSDGLPQSLEECTNTYGLKHFKVKICGDIRIDSERLANISKVLDTNAPTDFAFSLDGNEQFIDPVAFRGFWEELNSQSNLKSFFKRLLFVEQPLHRDVALNEDIGEVLHAWTDRPSIIIDESDGDLDSARKAIQLGYDGTSHKNCKGVFKSVSNYLMIQKLNQDSPSRLLIQSGEDLCNQGPVSIMQDLCVAASLGIQSVERNGHHYCAGLSAHPVSVQHEMLKHHPDVYAPAKKGWPSLAMDHGCISMRSINASPFGIQCMPTLSDYENVQS
ncbi:hypothetical protein N8843_09175 [Verrucomicrobia bacterium]|nr:hypothetical protein [Verrucomicrobiota bacterium]MDA7628795.1 hypothetical protein [Verrucomicrobiota bacterium]